MDTGYGAGYGASNKAGNAANMPQRRRANFTPVTFQMIREGNATPDDCVELDGAVVKEVSANIHG